MADINNQTGYWDKVASQKSFTHPIDLALLKKYLPLSANILDYGCGYGRLTSLLKENGFYNVSGIDTSAALIGRGLKENPGLNLIHIDNPASLPFKDAYFDAILLFAVLTCIPENKAQSNLIHLLFSKLKRGGIIYVSDYYLQTDSKEMKSYTTLNNDDDNMGVFTLPEGATFRHHTEEWIKNLFQDFDVTDYKIADVYTMNGHTAKAFQLIGSKR